MFAFRKRKEKCFKLKGEKSLKIVKETEFQAGKNKIVMFL